MSQDRRLGVGALGRLLASAAAGMLALQALGRVAAAADPSDPSGIALYETESTRSPSRLLETPQAISVVSRQEIEQGRPAIALDEALDLVPGVFAQGGRNFAQDTRVSIRGYGARAEFGVGGIRMTVDGVPSTLPDGQTELDSLDMAFVDRIEVVRGPVSSLYGGGGGGTIAVTTIEPTEQLAVNARMLFGSDHLSRYFATSTGTVRGTGYALGMGWTGTHGYRDHANARQSVMLAKLERELPSGTQLTGIFNGVWAPKAEDPAGLRQFEVDADREDARADAVTGDAGERLDQHKFSLSARHPFGEARELRAMVYGLHRDFANALPLLVNRRVDLERNAQGGSLSWIDSSTPVRLTLGLDADVQNDIRRNFDNVFGLRGPLTLYQSETVRNVGPFAQAELDLASGLGFIAGLRYDWTEFDLGDRIVTDPDGDHSDQQRFRQLSPRFGVRYGHSTAFQTYANVATAFQVPTTTQLTDVDGSLSPLVDSETSLGFELGAKGLLAERLFYDVAIFELHLRHVAVPFGDALGNTVFRDAGEVRRRGLEVGLSALIRPGLSLRTGYTWANYRYRDFDVVDLAGGGFTEFDNEREPNTPEHLFSAELRYDRGSGPFAVVAVRHFTDIEVNDANTADSPGATVSDLRLGWTLRRGKSSWVPFLGARNWTQVKYDQTLRPNAPGARYFEPAPEAELYVGLDFGFE